MHDSSVYITIAMVALGLVAWILIRKKKSHRNLSPLATTAILLNIAGIIVAETQIVSETFGYSIISMGLLLSMVGILSGKKI